MTTNNNTEMPPEDLVCSCADLHMAECEIANDSPAEVVYICEHASSVLKNYDGPYKNALHARFIVMSNGSDTTMTTTTITTTTATTSTAESRRSRLAREDYDARQVSCACGAWLLQNSMNKHLGTRKHRNAMALNAIVKRRRAR